MAWTGTVLACTTFDNNGFTLSFRDKGDSWAADDPHGLLDVEEGTFISKFTGADLPATGCFSNNREYVLITANVRQLTRGAEGAGSIIGGSDFSWTCTTVE